MNMLGNIGGTIAPVVVGYAVERRGSWNIPFYVTAGVLALGVGMWLLIDPRRSVIGGQLSLSAEAKPGEAEVGL